MCIYICVCVYFDREWHKQGAENVPEYTDEEEEEEDIIAEKKSRLSRWLKRLPKSVQRHLSW